MLQRALIEVGGRGRGRAALRRGRAELRRVSGLIAVSRVVVALWLGLGASSVVHADALPGGPKENPPVAPRDAGDPAPAHELIEPARAAEPAEPAEMIGAPSAQLGQPSEFDEAPVPEVVGVQVDLEAGAVPDETPSPTRERSGSASAASSQVAVLGLAVLGLGLVAGFLLLRRRR